MSKFGKEKEQKSKQTKKEQQKTKRKVTTIFFILKRL